MTISSPVRGAEERKGKEKKGKKKEKEKEKEKSYEIIDREIVLLMPLLQEEGNKRYV